VPGELTIRADWERLDAGSPEERACFAALNIAFDDVQLAEGSDAYVNRIRSGPMLSAYHLAQWVAWNWWRLRWEPRSNASDWAFAHHLTTIGEGYVWPYITVSSDGELVRLVAKPTRERAGTPFRYINDFAGIVKARQFESAVDEFVEQVCGQLRAESIPSTNLDHIWAEVREERRDPEIARHRKLEALLGRDPDETDEATIGGLVADSAALGELGVNEIAAEHAHGGELLTAEAVRSIAERNGFDASPRDVIRLMPGAALPRADEVPAWRLGAEAAVALREQQGLGAAPISDSRLADFAAVQRGVLTSREPGPSMSFALDQGPATGRVVLRSRWGTGRRFELARLLGDRIVRPANGRFFPATRAYTYRQKMQRSFAAEFLSPFAAVDEQLGGDYSLENQQDVAEHFSVSELTIRTLLLNHRRIEREDFDGDVGLAGA
jgi:hypothetical protein